MSKLLLVALSGFALYSIWYYSYITGLKDLGDATIEAKLAPGTKFPLRTVYTGLPLTDRLLTTLTVFFWPIADAQDIGLFLHSFAFSGTFGAAWTLVSLESWRHGNIWTLAAFPMLPGLGCQVFTFAFVTPLYAAMQLATSITAVKPTAHNTRIPRAILVAIPVVYTIGCQVPGILMILPRSEWMTADLKQLMIAIWQPWPAYVSILLTISSVVLPAFLQEDNATPAGNRRYRTALRHAYAFTFGGVAVSHLVSVIIPLASVLAPTLFQKSVLGDLHPFKVFETPRPWASPAPQLLSVAQGTKNFLRWDYIVGTLGTLVWATTLYTTAHRNVYGRVDYVDLARKVVPLTLLSGPVGAAVQLMWERDELLLQTDGKPVVTAHKKGL